MGHKPMPDPSSTPENEGPLDDALLGLFDIAREDDARELAALQEQLRRLPKAKREALLEDLIDVDTFGSYLRKANQGTPIDAQTRVPFEDAKMEKVDTVLHALARVEEGDKGPKAIQGLSPDERVHVLFDSLGRR